MNAHINMWSQLRPFSVGFDSLFDRLDHVNAIHKQESYPPYNIVKISEEKFAIQMAVAGFSKKHIAVEHQENIHIQLMNLLQLKKIMYIKESLRETLLVHLLLPMM